MPLYAVYVWGGSSYTAVSDAEFKRLECRDTAGCVFEFTAASDYTGKHVVLGLYAGAGGSSLIPAFTGVASCHEEEWGGVSYNCKARSWFYNFIESAIAAGTLDTTLDWFLKRATVVTDSTLCINALGCPLPNIAWVEPTANTPPTTYAIRGENLLFETRRFIAALHRSGFYVPEGVERKDIENASSEVRTVISVMGGSMSAATIEHDGVKWLVRGFKSGGSGTVIVRGWSAAKAVYDDLTFTDDGSGTYYTDDLSLIPVEGTLRVYTLAQDQDGNKYEVYELCPEIDYTLDWHNGSYKPPRIQLLNDKYKDAEVRARYKGRRYVQVKVGSGAPARTYEYSGGDPTLDATTTGSPEQVFTSYADSKHEALTKPAALKAYQPLAYYDQNTGDTVFFEVFTEDWLAGINSDTTIHGAPLVGAQVTVKKGDDSVLGIVRSWRLELGGRHPGIIMDIASPVRNIDLAEPFRSLGVEISQVKAYAGLLEQGGNLGPIDGGRIVPV